MTAEAATGDKNKFQALFEQALALQRSGDTAKAEALYRKLLTYFPDHTPSLINLGVILKNAGYYDAAVAVYTRAYTLDATSISVLGNLGNVLLLSGRFDEALACHEQVLKTKPDSPEAYFNKGLTLRAMGRLQQATFCFDRALALRADYAEAEWDRSLTMLMNNELQEGFAAYEARWKLPNVERPALPGQGWTGSDPAGKRILMYAEQGFGDTLQFIRYGQLLKQKRATVIAYVQNELVDLLKGCTFLDEVYGYKDTIPGFDAHAPLMSLPFLLGTTNTTVPASVPYVAVPPAAPFEFLKRPKNEIKVGICWAGKPTHKNDRNRTIGLAPFLKLLAVPRTALFGLQVSDRQADIAEYGADGLVYNLAPHIKSFVDTAQILQQLDLVITVDTSLAHLAGAMGRPVWLVLPMVGDWRWLQHGEKTSWYPSMQIFRQTEFGNWDNVFDDVVQHLDKLASSRA